MMLTSQRHLFQIPDDVTYLNCAYMSPLMKHVVDAGRSGLDSKARPWEITPEQFFTVAEEFRNRGAQLFDCFPDSVAIIPSASYGITTAARNLQVKKGQAILLLEEQFPSNFYPWQRLAAERGALLKVVAWPEDGDWTSHVLNALTDEVAIAALPNVHWTSGGQLDLPRIGEVCRRQGTALALDLTQSLGALPFSARDVQPDFAVAACYKWLMGPYSVGLLYAAPKWHCGQPLEENWIQRSNARDFSSLVMYTEEYNRGARRFDMGERSNFALLPAAERALMQVLEWGIPEISETLGVFSRQLAMLAGDLGFSTLPEHLRAPHYLCLRRETGIPASMSEILEQHKVFVSVRGTSVRVTPHVYNCCEDIHRLISCLRIIS